MQLLRKKGLLDSPRVLFLPVDAISPNPNQPRRVFGTQELEELAGSIQALGLLQPLTVRRRADGWELVAGERRLRAAKLAGLEEVPCISLQIDDQRSSLLALVENLQRKDLDFWEEALALDRLISVYHLSQEEAARRIGKSQSAVANKLRLLKLPEDTLRALRDGPASAGGPQPAPEGPGADPVPAAHRGPDRRLGRSASLPSSPHQNQTHLCGEGCPPFS